MANTAENIAASGNVPSNWADGAQECVDNVATAYEHLDSLADDAQVPAKMFHTDEESGEVTEQELEETMLHPLINRENTTGLFAYRYELCDDGSCVAVYVKGRDGEVKMKAFDSIESASKWSPRDES